MSLSKLPHNTELLGQLKEGMVKIKGHQEHIENLIFSGKRLVKSSQESEHVPTNLIYELN